MAASGIIKQASVAGDGRRSHYRLTQGGIDLAPVLVDMTLWYAAYEQTGAPNPELTFMRNHRERFIAEVTARWRAARV